MFFDAIFLRKTFCFKYKSVVHSTRDCVIFGKTRYLKMNPKNYLSFAIVLLAVLKDPIKFVKLHETYRLLCKFISVLFPLSLSPDPNMFYRRY